MERTNCKIEDTPLLMGFTTPKKRESSMDGWKYNFVYDPVRQVTFYFEDGAKGTQSKRTNNEGPSNPDRMRYFDDD